MKKILILLSLMALLLSACGSERLVDEELDPDMVATVVAEMMATQTAAEEITAAQVAIVPVEETPIEVVPSGFTLSIDFENAAPIQTQLFVGIYQLENTALTITKEQANFLYSQFLSLQTSMTNQTTITEEEIDALVLQQAAVLSAEQIQAITDLQITQESVMTTMQELGIESDQRGGGGEAGDATGAGGGAGGVAGAPPADGSGAPQGGGGGQGGGGQTGTAPEGVDDRNNLIPPELIDAIISLLESKISS